MMIYLAMGLAAAWLVVCIGLIVFARTMIYPFQPGFSAAQPVGVPGVRATTFTAGDGMPVTIWLVPPGADRPTVLYFMGNGGSLPSHAPLLAEIAKHGFGVVALNYRGAGGAPGKPSQAALTADALALYDQLDAIVGEQVPATRRVLYGTSLGAALAVQLAAERPSAGLVLESPFNRLCEVAQFHYPIFPACLLLPYERWDSAGRIGEVATPVLILHGEADETIPVSQGQALFTAAHEPKRLIVYPGADHNGLNLHGSGADAIAFINGLAGD